MVTQLQDVANTVAQKKISNQRLRNEEIRRQMANPWSEPIETPTTSTGIQPLQNAAASGNTLASTYSSLLNNYNSYQNTTGQTSSGNTTFGNPGITGRMPGWSSTVVGTGLGLAGAGIAAPIGAASIQLMSGNRAGAARTLGSLFTNVATKGSIPGLPGVVGSLASGLIGDKSKEEIGQDVFNSLLGTGLSALNPIAGTGYQALRFFGIDPARGLQNLFFPDKTVPESWRGTFTSSGYTPPAGSWMSSGNENYSPYGGSQYNRVGDSSSSSSSSSGYGESSFGGYSPTMNYGSNSGSYWSGSSGSSLSSDNSSDSDSESSDGGW